MSDLLDILPAHVRAEYEALGRTDGSRRIAARKLGRMRAQHGPAPAGITCGECVNLQSIRHNTRNYRKCKLYGNTRCESSDWSAKWPGCGAFVKS